jgi:alanyl-tRNA synthetase
MMESVQRVARIVKDEEHRYATTFLVAEKVFSDELAGLSGEGVPGAVSFKLYDTYGLALDEQEDMARERGFEIDRDAFEAEMRQQRERARASWKGGDKAAIAPGLPAVARKRPHALPRLRPARCRFEGHRDSGRPANGRHRPAGTEAEIVLDQTPFYAETGGQVGDRGMLYDAHTGETVATVLDTWPAVPGLTVHKIRTLASVKSRRRTARRSGRAERFPRSVITPRRICCTPLCARFSGRMSSRPAAWWNRRACASISRITRPRPRRDRRDRTARQPSDSAQHQVTTNVMAIDEAIATGAMALFGEKYGDQVRVVSIPDFSKELCGGTHVARTGDIGVFKIVSESSISAGVRRIEAITGEPAVQQFQQSTDALHRMSGMLRVSEPELVEQVERLLAEKRASERQIDQLKTKIAQSAAHDLESRAKEKNGARFIAAQVDGLDRQQMRALADALRNKWKSGVIALASVDDGAVSIVAAVTKDLTGRMQAGKLVSALALAVGGKGGGRPDMAEGGGKDPSALPHALANIFAEIESKL